VDIDVFLGAGADAMRHTRRAVLTGPIPTVAQVARKYGVSRRRVERLERLIDSFIARDTSRRRTTRAKKKLATKRGR